MIFRELVLSDATRVAHIESDLFADDNPWSRDAFVAEFAAPHTFYVGAFVPDEETGEELLVGYAGLAMLGPRTDPEFEVHTIGVDRAHQGKGIGRALMDQLVHAADLLGGPIFLEVRTDNTPAIALYESYGFYTLATRKAYYQPSGADAFTMTRPAATQPATKGDSQ